MEYKLHQILKNQKTTEFSYDALGVIRKENYSIFVFGMLDNEEADVELIKVNSKFAFAKIVNLIKKNPKRIDNKDLKTVSNNALSILKYEDQLEFKQNIVSYLFKRQLNYENINSIIPSENQWNYRNKVVLFVENKDNKYKLGTYEKMSHTLIEEENYNLAVYSINKVVNFLSNNINSFNLYLNKIKRIMIRATKENNQVQVVFITENKQLFPLKFLNLLKNEIGEIASIIHNIDDKKNKNNLLGNFYKVIFGKEYLIDTLGDFKFKLNWNSFFQVNAKQAITLYNAMLKAINITENDVVLDAYCGIGTITTFLAQKAKKVIGVEIVKEAIDNAKESQEINAIENIEFYANDIDKQMEILNQQNIKFDVISVDPPRSGLTNEFMDLIIKQAPKAISYISCNVHTLVRDLVYLSKYYKIDFVQPVDMFPQTPHIEIVVILSKINVAS
ncbi:23S rRNA (uracil(1939)-C(5))-methyltransferase RlmD [Mycoplasma zalophi]|uniref:23S rRNA (Uracil(1939)-C(5))-methyltransferase RlmD n=1 Tax=Mycoplasma zalophi TaxID=191287 RepID=A0ABS6DQA6_9MOLU|nr:23S rRNA (uracil(1939)-C(5))-methyltransferase RlmD [Mycoplasma zalophi]MBU4692112.1 23S rRNA (uracil(1939)-C(5))-methyltransferase RlmD [Mycoplasma zalophi]